MTEYRIREKIDFNDNSEYFVEHRVKRKFLKWSWWSGWKNSLVGTNSGKPFPYKSIDSAEKAIEKLKSKRKIEEFHYIN